MLLTHRFEEGFLLASRLHRQQARKGSDIPYLAHLLAVAALVLEEGGDEDEAISAMLHDAVEDQGGLETLEIIRGRFGEHVAEIVLGCTDSVETPKPPWRGRKEAFLGRLETAPDAVLRVSLADKLHNARTLLKDLMNVGPQVWERFNGGESGTRWYYKALAATYQACYPGPMQLEFQRVVSEIEAWPRGESTGKEMHP